MDTATPVMDEFGVYWVKPRSKCYKFCESCDARFDGYPSILKPRKFCTRSCGGANRSRAGASDKTCSSCQVTKPLSAFSKNAASSDGCYSICRVCRHEKIVSEYTDFAPVGHRTCKVCSIIKPLSEFLTATEARLRPATCATCKKARQKITSAANYLLNADRERSTNRVRYAVNSDLINARTRSYRVGITAEEYNRILLAQNSVCALCGLPERSTHNGGDRVRSLAVDHCHETDIVRGLLCLSCNTMLGKVESIGLENVSDYLDI